MMHAVARAMMDRLAKEMRNFFLNKSLLFIFIC